MGKPLESTATEQDSTFSSLITVEFGTDRAKSKPEKAPDDPIKLANDALKVFGAPGMHLISVVDMNDTLLDIRTAVLAEREALRLEREQMVGALAGRNEFPEAYLAYAETLTIPVVPSLG